MITFARASNTKKRFTAIPRQVDALILYIMYCGDKAVGTTYGIAVRRLDVKTPSGERYQFDIDQLKKIQKRNISRDDLLKYAKKITLKDSV